MKKLLILATLCFVIQFLASCSKNDDAHPKTTNTMLFAYSGVIVGSSGHYKVEVDTNGGTATVVFDLETHNLSVQKRIESDKDIDSLVMKDDIVTVIYSYKYATATPSVTISIKGHDITYTVSTLYDHRHPELYTIKDGIRLYEGSSHATSGSSYYDATYNFSFDLVQHTFKAIEKCTASSSPGDIGKTVEESGNYTETATTLTIFFGTADSLVFTKDTNDLKHEESGADTYFSIHLKYVNF